MTISNDICSIRKFQSLSVLIILVLHNITGRKLSKINYCIDIKS